MLPCDLPDPCPTSIPSLVPLLCFKPCPTVSRARFHTHAPYFFRECPVIFRRTMYSPSCPPTANAYASLYFIERSVFEDSISDCVGGGRIAAASLCGHFSPWSFLHHCGQHLLPFSCLFRLPNAGFIISHKHTRAVRSTFLVVPRDKYFYIVRFHIFH